MADSSATPPPKDVVTTRTPTPTSPINRPESQAAKIADAEEATAAVNVVRSTSEPEPAEQNTEEKIASPVGNMPSADPAKVSEANEGEPVSTTDNISATDAADDSALQHETPKQGSPVDEPEQSSIADAPSLPATESAEVNTQETEALPGEASKTSTPHVDGSKTATPQADDSGATASQLDGFKTTTPQAESTQPTTPHVEGSQPTTPHMDGTKTTTSEDEASKAETPADGESKEVSQEPTTEKVATPPNVSKPGSPQATGSKATSPQPQNSQPSTPHIENGIRSSTPQPLSSKTTTPQAATPKAVTPHVPTPQATTPAAEREHSKTPASPVKETSELKASPDPPPTAQTEAVSTADVVQPPSTADSSLPQALSPSTPEKTNLSALSEGDEANIITGNALSMVWSFGSNKNIPMANLSTDTRSIIVYACAHTGICYNFESNTQKLLQGHNNNISSTCVSEDKRWLATADKGSRNCMVIVWDTSTFFPVQTIFDAGDQGVVAMALTPDARYLATVSAGTPQVLCIWDWTVEGDTALCSATLDPSYGVQNFVLFNPDDTTQIVSNSDSQVIFYAWDQDGGVIEYFCPPLCDEDFNKPVGKYTQSIFLENSNKCLTATSIGNLVVWASNKPLTKAIDNEPTPNKKALKLVKVQERGINVLMITDSQIVMGDMNGHVKMFDQNVNLIHWYQDLHIGPINAISFTHIEKWGLERMDTQDFPSDCSLVGRPLAMRNFVVGSTQGVYAQITPKGTGIDVILRNHDSPIHSIVTHPNEKKVFIGSYAGLLQIWDYERRVIVASRKFDRGSMIQCVAIDPKGYFVAVGFTNGVVKVLDALNLQDEDTEPFRYSRDAITQIKFSHDSEYIAAADGEFTTTLFKRQHGVEEQPWIYIGRHKAHYKEIKDVCFGVELDTNEPRLLTLGKDRNLVEYDLVNSTKDNLLLKGVERIEQSAVPQCIAWYPPLNKEHFIVIANDQFKFKLYNVTTKRCRKTVLGPTYGSPLKKICMLPTANELAEKRYLAYINDDKIGLHILPLDGNPHNSMALVAHPAGVSNMTVSFDGKYLFTTGGSDTTVHMWHINLNALEAQSKLGGEDLIPFYGLVEGGREGELFAELEDYFYYAQLRHQGINTMMKRQVDTKIALSEVPYVMRAMGFYPSEQEVEDMLNEVKFSRYVETGEDVTEIDLGNFIKLYINHRPAFGLSQDKIAWCFDVLSGKPGADASIKRGQFLDLLQRKGEHMTEYELSEYLTTLLGYNEEGGSCEQHLFDPSEAGSIIVNNLPVDMSTRTFADDLLGFGFYQPADILTLDQNGNEE